MATEKLGQALASFPSRDHQQQFCKPGKQDQCAYFRTRVDFGDCTLNSRTRRKTLEAANCDGILGVIKTHSQAFVDAPLSYLDLPFFIEEGVLKVLEIEGSSVKITPELPTLNVTPHYANPVIDIFNGRLTFSNSRLLDSTSIRIPDVEVPVPEAPQPKFGALDPRRYLSRFR